jgi:hypothetical protein
VISQRFRQLAYLDAFRVSLTEVAGEGLLALLIKKHGFKRAGADTRLAAIAETRVDLNGACLRIFGQSLDRAVADTWGIFTKLAEEGFMPSAGFV